MSAADKLHSGIYGNREGNMSNSKPADDPLLAEAQASERLGVTPKCMQAWRSRGEGPRFVKLGAGTRAPVRYRLSELHRWLESCERQSTAEHSAKAAA